MSAITAHIDRLRDLCSSEDKAPTLEQLRVITRDVFDAVPLSGTVARPELAEFTEAEICAIAEDFGKFRARSAKGDAKARTYLYEEFLDEAGMLFPPTREDLLDWNKRLERSRHLPNYKGDTAPTWAGQPVPLWFREVPTPVLIPSGYEPHSVGRNIRASLAALVKSMPSEEELHRFYNRRYATEEAELTAEHLHLVWWLALMGMGYKLDDLTASQFLLNQSLVAAHDVIETSIRDARHAMATLAEADAPTASASELSELVHAASWTHPATFSRLTPVVSSLAEQDSERVRRMLSMRLNGYRAWYAAEGARLVDIAQLNEAHLRALVERAGLAYDAATERVVRAEIRTRLVELGLGSDLDQEVPAGVTAWRRGRLAEFYASREARAAGDADWATLYAATEEDAEVPAAVAIEAAQPISV